LNVSPKASVGSLIPSAAVKRDGNFEKWLTCWGLCPPNWVGARCNRLWAPSFTLLPQGADPLLLWPLILHFLQGELWANEFLFFMNYPVLCILHRSRKQTKTPRNSTLLVFFFAYLPTHLYF
jgi:hypothetical protein